MDWKSVGETLAKIGLPLLGAALPLPGGAALGTALASAIGAGDSKPETILAALTSDANKIQQAREFELRHQETILKITTDAEIEQRRADSADIASVNTTMQHEADAAASEPWYQKFWRPFNGFVVGLASFIAVCGVFWLLYLGIVMHDANAINAIPGVALAVASILAVPGAAVGITAWHRGVAQVEQVKGSNNGTSEG